MLNINIVLAVILTPILISMIIKGCIGHKDTSDTDE